MKSTVMLFSIVGLAIAPASGYSMKTLKSPAPSKMQKLKQLGTGIQSNLNHNVNALVDKVKKTGSSIGQGTTNFVKETKNDIKSLANDKRQQAQYAGMVANGFVKGLRHDTKKTLLTAAKPLRYPALGIGTMVLGHGLIADLFSPHMVYANSTLDSSIDNFGMGFDGLMNATGDGLREASKDGVEYLRGQNYTEVVKQSQDAVSNGFNFLSNLLGAGQDLAKEAANATAVNGSK